MSNVFFGRTTAEDDIKNKRFHAEPKRRINGVEKGDYVFMSTKQREINALWEAGDFDNINNNLNFKEILSFNSPISIADFSLLNLFKLDSNLAINVPNANQGINFLKLEIDNGFNNFIKISDDDKQTYLREKKNYREILYKQNFSSITSLSQDIQIYKEGNQIKLHGASFINLDIVNKFSYNNYKLNYRKGNVGKVYDAIQNRKENLTSAGVIMQNFYTVFCSGVENKAFREWMKSKNFKKVDIKEILNDIKNIVKDNDILYNTEIADVNALNIDKSRTEEVKKSVEIYNSFLREGSGSSLGKSGSIVKINDVNTLNDDIKKSVFKNIILYGPPGTGKTYNTVEKALKIIYKDDKTNLDIIYDGDKFKYEKAKEKYDELLKDGRIQFVTFHQSYGYEDFIQGIKAETNTTTNNIEYHVKNGIFKAFCDKAKGDNDAYFENLKKYNEQNGNNEVEKPTEKPYVFIIDEINRGNISKIFGELITLIEETKRAGMDEAMSVTLPYGGTFSVPNNVYIIGTMNTADRSIKAMDTALRRRFHFEEMMPDVNLLKGVTVNGIEIDRMLETMNKRISVLLDREHQIGHAFFMGLKNNNDFGLLQEIFKNKIIPLLQEYFYEDYEKIRLVLADNQVKNEIIQFVKKYLPTKEDLFGDSGLEDFEDTFITYEINEDAFTQGNSYIKIYKTVNATGTASSIGSTSSDSDGANVNADEGGNGENESDNDADGNGESE